MKHECKYKILLKEAMDIFRIERELMRNSRSHGIKRIKLEIRIAKVFARELK